MDQVAQFRDAITGPPGRKSIFPPQAIEAFVAAFELSNVRRELIAAIDALSGEVQGERLGRTMGKAKAIDHCRTALLLLEGSTSASIWGHPRGSDHTDDAEV